MSWPTQFDRHERVFSNTGSPVRAIFKPIIDKETGHYELEETREVKPVYEEIQSFKDSCDIKKLVARYTAGETDALNQVQGVYGDLVTMPKNVFEFFALEEKISDYFDKLPTDIKERFDNSYINYTLVANNDPETFFRRHDMPSPVEKAEEGDENKE